MEETSTFASYYYPPEVSCRRTKVPRNDDGGEGCSTNPSFSIFNYPGRPSGKCVSCLLEQREMKAAHLYILLNCPEVEPYLMYASNSNLFFQFAKLIKYIKLLNLWPQCSTYENFLRELGSDDSEVDKHISTNFPTWFKEHVC